MRRLAIGLAIVGFGALTVLAHGRVRTLREDFPRDQDLYYLPPARHLELASLGYREALADLVWIRALLLASDVVQGQNHAWILRYVDAITTLAPNFRRAYHWGGVVFVYTGQDIDRDMLDRALEVYRQGLEICPEDHEMLFGAGMILVRGLPTTEGYSEAEIAAGRREGAAMIRKAAAFGAPPVVRQYAATLIDASVSEEMALQFLEAQYLETDDADYRRLLRKKIEALADPDRLETLDSVRREFFEERAAKFPYLPDTTYAVIRPDTSF